MISQEDLMCRMGRILQPGKELLEEGASRRKHRWSKSWRKTGGGRWMSGRHHHHHHHPRLLQRPPSGATMFLRPVNVKGNRARGMRAPKNTNQFLMHEKYQLLHMRSDSVGSDSSSGSDSDADFTDMDSYLGVLENARGALLDSPAPRCPAMQSQVLPRRQQQLCMLSCREDGLRGDCLRDNLRGDSLRDGLQEDSLQYFPSEDDLTQSQHFMQKDFVEFCDTMTS